MGVGRRFNKISQVRPIKKGRARRRRDKVQARRLVALGVPAEKVAKMTTKAVRTLLKYPAKLKAAGK